MLPALAAIPAAIPFFGLSVYNLEIPGVGTIPLDPWALLVCLGFVLGLEISRHRAIRLGLDVRDVVDGAVFTVVMGFVIGHIYTVLFYFPERLSSEGIWALLQVWTGFSSVGGFIGAVIGSLLFYRVLRKRDYLRHADVISFGFPFGWFFGRLGCGVVHDHIGTVTTMPWGMDFDRGYMNFQWVDGDPFPWASGVRHELGLYEAAFMIPVMALWLYLGRKDRVPGFFTLLFFVIYAPIRILLDFLRTDDATYYGLTPAQYGLAAFFVVGVILLVRLPYKSFVPWPLDAHRDEPRSSSDEPAAEGAAAHVDDAPSSSDEPAGKEEAAQVVDAPADAQPANVHEAEINASAKAVPAAAYSTSVPGSQRGPEPEAAAREPATADAQAPMVDEAGARGQASTIEQRGSEGQAPAVDEASAGGPTVPVDAARAPGDASDANPEKSPEGSRQDVEESPEDEDTAPTDEGSR